MLMLITELPPIGVEPEGILYRTPDELAHTDANTPVVVVIDLALRCPDKIGQSRIKQPEQFSNTSC